MFQRVWFLAIGCLFFAACPALAWNIANYNIEIRLEEDSRFVVSEEIEADFGNESKHGIYRDILTTYQDENGRPINVRFDILSVRDGEGNSREFVKEGYRNYLRIKIGNARRTVSGRQTYVITYRVTGAILFFPDHDELFWNAVGNQWDVAIRRVRVYLYVPATASRADIRLATYTGPKGSKTSTARAEFVSDNCIIFEGEDYAPYEGFTIVAGLPKGTLTPPRDSGRYAPQDNYGGDPDDHFTAGPPVGVLAMFLPLAAFFVMLNIWQRFGKDPQLNKSVAVEYAPPANLTPAEMGTLIDHKVDQRDITATIIDLAVRGYLKIVQHKGLFWSKDYTLVGLKKFDDDASLKPHEIKILRSIFGYMSYFSDIKLSDLQNNFYKNLVDIEEKIRKELKLKGYVANNPKTVVTLCGSAAVVIFAAGMFLAGVDFWVMFALMLSAVIVFLFGLVMPKRTVAGTEVLSKILGFKEFLSRTDKDKIQRAEQQNIFERMLPYAVCLGISTKWAAKFSGLYTQPPQWFDGGYGNAFVFDHFIHDLDHSLNQMGTSFYSSPQSVSSGGGFSSGGSSGGGFGGGGGGSW